MKPIRLLGAFAGLILFVCGTAWSQPYPSKPVRVVVVFPAGGGTDTVARLVFQKVGEQLKQQFVIENRGGASGMIGGAMVAKSPPDGYTLMVYSQTLLVSAHVYQKTIPYDVLKDFTGISMLTRLVGMLAVHPSMPVRTTKQLIALAKARPGEIHYGTAGVGAYQHLATSVFTHMAGINMSHVPFKGGAPAVVALMSGEIQAVITPIAELFPHVKAGRVRAIAVTSDRRSAQFPEVPTIGETVKGYEFVSWFGCFAPAGTPKPIVDRLNAEIKQAVADPGLAAKLSAQGLDPLHMAPEEFTRLLKSEYDRLAQVVKDSGARVE
jgi:tripartite-type tricarboxylate transporter receptor subunit TctC